MIAAMASAHHMPFAPAMMAATTATVPIHIVSHAIKKQSFTVIICYYLLLLFVTITYFVYIIHYYFVFTSLYYYVCREEVGGGRLSRVT